MQNKMSIFLETDTTDVCEPEAAFYPPPCRMTLSELKTELRLSVEGDLEKTSLTTETIEEYCKMYPTGESVYQAFEQKFGNIKV